MKGPKMLGLTTLAVFGFVVWAFFQRAFIESTSNAKDANRLLVFPILVPILAGICVYAGYFITQKRAPHQFIVESLKVRSNIVFILLSAVGLGAAYFLYTLLVSDSPKNIVMIPTLNTVGLVVVAFFVTNENGNPKLGRSASALDMIGASIIIIGSLIMMYDRLSKR
jgi:hypothetical protein